jgi:hypothetical protein
MGARVWDRFLTEADRAHFAVEKKKIPYGFGTRAAALSEAVSGCVRATVVDGCSYRLNMIVVEECVYDQHETLRAINLLDMDRKYGDVVSLADTLTWIRDHPGGIAPAQEASSATSPGT